MKELFALAALLVAFGAQAQVYKCSEGGKTVFSDSPCQGNAGKEIKIRPASGSAPPTSVDTPVNSSNNPQAVLASIERERQVRSLTLDIDALDRSMKEDIKRMTGELEALKAKKAHANNNLAGATWEASISQEMLAVTQRYQMKATADQARLEQMRAERTSLAH